MCGMKKYTTKVSNNLQHLNLLRGLFFSIQSREDLRHQLSHRCFYFKQAVCDEHAANMLLKVEFAERMLQSALCWSQESSVGCSSAVRGIPKDTSHPSVNLFQDILQEYCLSLSPTPAYSLLLERGAYRSPLGKEPFLPAFHHLGEGGY